MNRPCPNMNHGRSIVSIKHCPTCGELLNRSASGRCDANRHAQLRKDRHIFCTDCGKKLAKD